MDPLSITTSSIALAEVVLKGAMLLKDCLGARDDIQSLISEVSGIEKVLRDAKDVLEERRSHKQLSQEGVARGTAIVLEANSQLMELKKLLEGCVKEPPTNEHKIKLAWISWLKTKSKIKKLQRGVMDCRLGIASFWGVVQVSDDTRMELSLEEITLLNQEQLEILREHSRILTSIAQHVAKPQQQREDETYEKQPNAEKVEERSNINASNKPNTCTDLVTTRRMNVPAPGQDQEKMVVRQRYQHYRPNPCGDWCSCRCHKSSKLQTPQWFASVMGNLLLSYKGIQLWPRACNDKRCRRQSEPRVEATYGFPSWLFQRMFYLAVSIQSAVGPRVDIQPLRVVAPSSPVFSYAVQGNLPKIQELFSKGLASPYDVAANNGRTPLHYATIYNHYALSQFLLDTGASPLVRDGDNESTVSLVWNRIFGKLFNEQREVDAWRCMFDDEDHLESRAFPKLHKIGLGLASGDSVSLLRTQLNLDASDIDEQDSDGYTALIWAASRGDDESVSLLLKFGADANVSNKRKQTALHMAAQGHDPRVIKIMRDLIRSGAEPDPVDFWGRTPLLYAAAEQDFDDSSFLEPLLETGKVNLNVQDIRDRTPLGYAALMGRCKTVEALLHAGADPAIAANWGYTAAIEALAGNHHGCLEILLKHHSARGLPLVNPKVELVGGRNLLHIIAQHADASTMTMVQSYPSLLASSLSCTAQASKSAEGLTPDDSFIGREDVDEKLTLAWNELLRVTEELFFDHISQHSTDQDVEEDAEKDAFVDAQEFL